MEIYCQQRKSVYINGNKSKILKGKEGKKCYAVNVAEVMTEAVTLCDGYKAGGTYTVKAASESEAQEKALTEICDKLYRALPELDIEVSVELLED